MSSTYRVLCLSHDPALVLNTEWSSGANGRAAMMVALADPAGEEQLASHVHCDLLGGCYSYPLIEVYCPPQRKGVAEHSPYHPHSGQWIDVEWLRLLAVAYASSDPAVTATVMPGCWGPDRLRKLRPELGLNAA